MDQIDQPWNTSGSINSQLPPDNQPQPPQEPQYATRDDLLALGRALLNMDRRQELAQHVLAAVGTSVETMTNRLQALGVGAQAPMVDPTMPRGAPRFHIRETVKSQMTLGDTNETNEPSDLKYFLRARWRLI
ncbi:hypothetical protein HGRIS_000772 [Hohenbuehelia grisea]|uniref:Uncharacterized protein n=1 Tax=Hohenbuehelia grisea TaxID=104357 RepID=A0ABR3IPN5_9AGAR